MSSSARAPVEYTVSPEGRDDQPGTAAAPFRTLARAGEVLQPGDTCVLRGGLYRETLRPARSGKAGRPIVYRAFPGEVPILTGTEPLSDWRPEAGGLWSAPMRWDLADRNQLFAGREPLPEARWPHTPPDEDAFFRPRRARVTAGSPTTLTDPALPGDADAWRGALLWCAGGAKWICWGARVTGYDPATHTLTFERNRKVADVAWYTPKAGSEYVLMDARAALGAPGEWWFDREAGRVWLTPPPGCADPAAAGIEAKRRLAVADLRGRSHVHLVGLQFRAGGILTDTDSAHLRLEALRGEWLAHSYEADASSEAVVLAGRGHLVYNCELRHSSGAVLRLRGEGHRLINCLVERGNYAGLWTGALAVAGRGHLLRHNTVRHSGRDLLTLHGLTGSIIEYNDLAFAGWLTHDLGITYGHDTDFGGTRIRYNHVHDCVAQGLAQGIYFDHCSHNVAVHHNLFWNIPDMPVQVNNPSYHNLIAHNSAWRTNTRLRQISTFDHSHRNDLYGCRFLNNLFNAPFALPPHVRLAGNGAEPDPGYADPAAGDFRLSVAAAARGTGVPIRGLSTGEHPDPGALGPDDLPWRAGRDPDNPPDPEAPVARPPLAGLNLLRNAAFELGTLEGWAAAGRGRAEIVKGNGWGNRVHGDADVGTGTSKHELRLSGGGSVTQPVAGLQPGARYRLSGWLRTADPAHPVALVARGFGGEPVTASCAATAWNRVELEFTVAAGADAVTVELRQDPAAPATACAWADNLGLVEID